MRKTLLSLALLTVLTPSLANADEITTTSELKAATVYADRASLTRVAEVDIPAGKHTIIFEDLTTRLYPDSLRIDGKGTANATLGALSHKVVNNVDDISERKATLLEQKTTLERGILNIETQKKAIAAKRDFLKSLQAQAVKKTNEEQLGEFQLNTEEWIKAADTISQGMAEVLQAELALNIQKEELQKQINKLNQDIAQLGSGNKRSYEVRLPIEAARAGKITLELSYQLPGASWRPVYDARLKTKEGDLELVQYGAVTQRTGEDWSDIELTLSTARPHRGATAPSLHTMWVDIAKAYAKKARNYAQREMVMGLAAAPMADMAMESSLEEDSFEKEISQQVATIDTGGLTAEFIIPGLASIPADGTQSKVLIAPFETDTNLQVHIKPQQNTSAYLIANTTLKGKVPILPGTVSLFRDGAYVGQTNTPLLRPGKDYDLSFGIDDQIEVTYNTLKDESGESGILIGKNKTIERNTVTDIQNLRGGDVEIHVMQVVPVSKNEDIKIAINKETTTEGYEEDKDNIKGLLTWTFDLKSQAKKDIKLGWSVSWPKDENLTGLR
jgi:uncharacterized protein (TIGR02231 family)